MCSTSWRRIWVSAGAATRLRHGTVVNVRPQVTLLIILVLFWTLLSMEGQITLRFHQKYLKLYSQDERRSYWLERHEGCKLQTLSVLQDS